MTTKKKELEKSRQRTIHDTILNNIFVMLQSLTDSVQMLKPENEHYHIVAKVNLEQALGAIRLAYFKKEQNDGHGTKKTTNPSPTSERANS